MLRLRLYEKLFCLLPRFYLVALAVTHLFKIPELTDHPVALCKRPFPSSQNGGDRFFSDPRAGFPSFSCSLTPGFSLFLCRASRVMVADTVMEVMAMVPSGNLKRATA